MSERKSIPKILPRRAFIVRGLQITAAAAAGGAIGVGIGSVLENERPENGRSILDTQRIYKDGEVIETPYVNVKIDGWRFLIDQEALKASTTEKSATFSISSSDAVLRQRLNVGFGGYASSALESEIEGRKYWELVAYPASVSPNKPQRVYLHVEERNIETDESKTTSYPVDISFDTHISGEEYQKVRFYSEIQLDEETKKRIDKMLAVFDKFTPRGAPQVYIFKDENIEYRGGVYSEGQTKVPSNLFTSPEFQDEGLAKIFHETCHGVMEQFLTLKADLGPSSEVFNAFKGLVEGAAEIDPDLFKIPMPSFGLFGVPKEVEENPYFSIFDESNYVNLPPDKYGQEGTYGHPYSNFDELFASALTVIRFFPDQFIENYDSLDAKVQEKVQKTVKAVFGVLTWFRKKPEDHQADLGELLPAYDRLAATFGL